MIGIKPTALLALTALAFPAAVWLHAEDRMRAGLWEVITTSDGKASEGSTQSTCYTPAMVEHANSSSHAIRENTEKNAQKTGCTIKEFRQDAKGMSMTKVCATKTTVTASTYGGDTFETVVKTTEGGVTKEIRMKGRRTGDCK